jgi:hypothetical protein
MVQLIKEIHNIMLPLCINPGKVQLAVFSIHDVKLRELELSLIAHSQGGVVPAVEHLRDRVGNWER